MSNVQRYAIVCDGVVDNVVLWDGGPDWSVPEGFTPIVLDDDSMVGPGDLVDEKGKLIERAEPPADPLAEARAKVASATSIAQLRNAVLDLIEATPT